VQQQEQQQQQQQQHVSVSLGVAARTAAMMQHVNTPAEPCHSSTERKLQSIWDEHYGAARWA
jgi:hypothetical protein